MIEPKIAIRTLREQLGHTQPEFAKILGVSLRTLARYENEVPPTKWSIIAQLGKMASDANRPDLLAALVEAHKDPIVVEASSGDQAIWLRGLQALLTIPDPETSAIVDEIQNKIAYTLRRLKTAGLNLEDHESDTLNAAVDECETEIAKRDMKRRVSALLYDLFNLAGDTSRPFEDLWNSIMGTRDYSGLHVPFEWLAEEASKPAAARIPNRAAKAIAKLDENWNPDTLPQWPALRPKIVAFFGIEDTQGGV